MEDLLSLDELLTELRLRQWTLFRWGRAEDPELVAAAYQWDAYADAVLLRRDRTASGYRTPTRSDTEVFSPGLVTYQYHGHPLWVVRAVLALPAPATGSGVHVETAHPACRVPANLPQPMVMRPLSPYPRHGRRP